MTHSCDVHEVRCLLVFANIFISGKTILFSGFLESYDDTSNCKMLVTMLVASIA